MAKKNSPEYWERRIGVNVWNTYNIIEEKNRALLELYQEASKNIRDELYRLGEKHSKKGVLTRSELYEKNHLEMLQKKYLAIIEKLGKEVQTIAAGNMQQGFREVYKNVAVELSVPDFAMPNKKMMEELLENPWLEGSFSSRLWKNQKLLVDALNVTLLTGLQQGRTVTEIAISLNSIMGTGFNNAHRLVRTETIHYLNQASLQSYKDTGIKKVQFWAAEDERTCERCGAMHRKIYDIDKAPILPLHPNCRCTYLPVIEDESVEKGNHSVNGRRVGDNKVDLGYIKSDRFRRKFNRITDNTSVNEALRQYATAMLTHRNGTDGEDVYIIDAKTGKQILRKIMGTKELEVSLTMDETQLLREKFFGQCIGIHNHPTNIYPTGSDFGAAGYRGYQFGVVVTHSGRVFKYSVGSKPFLPMLLDERIDKYLAEPYNMDIETAHSRVLKEFEKEYGITWEELE